MSCHACHTAFNFVSLVVALCNWYANMQSTQIASSEMSPGGCNVLPFSLCLDFSIFCILYCGTFALVLA